MPDYNGILAGYIELLIAYGSVAVGLALVYLCITIVMDVVNHGD